MNRQRGQPSTLGERLLARYHEALDKLINGDPDGYKSLFSRAQRAPESVIALP